MSVGDVTNRKCKMTLRQEIATDTFANQTLSNINPSLSLDKFAYIGGQIGTVLTDKTIDKLIRSDTYDVATE